MNQTDPSNFRDLLSHDHVRLDAMLASVLELTQSNVQPTLDDQWAVYEENLLSHLDAEEMFLLPGLAKHDSTGAARIRDEHTKIRALLAEVGIGLELHMVREEQMRELAQFLRGHAKMEEQLLYIWANTAIPESSFGLVTRRLRARWQRTRSSDSAEERSTDTVTTAPLASPYLPSGFTRDPSVRRSPG